MSRRSFLREITLLCLPIALIGGIFGWGQWQKRLYTPNIELTVDMDFDGKLPTLAKPFGFSPDEKLSFGWVANLKGGPEPSYRFGWNERIIAKTRSGSVVVWKQNTAPKAWQLDAISGFYFTTPVNCTFSSSQNLNRSTHSHRYEVDELALPLDTQNLEWQGEIVAIPSNNADIWQSPLPSTTLENWAQIDGAVKWQRNVALPYNPKNPVIIRSQKSPHLGSNNNEIKVEVLSRRLNRRAFRSLSTFDGKTKRVLWTDADSINTYCQSIGNGGYSARDGESLTFDLNRVPASWGEVTFLCDTVFDINKRAGIVPPSAAKWTQKQLDAFEKKVGGYRVSRSLVLRPASPAK
ncbi:hypothetical protein EON83_03025 [bacterium]|nr:MAG: hypothetical protein EON83_03025 [bacterium]